MKPCKEHQWGEWKTLYYEEFKIGFGSVRTCSICKWREHVDWCTTRTGMEIRLLSPEKQSET